MSQMMAHETELTQLVADALDSLEATELARSLREDQTKETLLQRLSAAERETKNIEVWRLAVLLKGVLNGKKADETIRYQCLRIQGLI